LRVVSDIHSQKGSSCLNEVLSWWRAITRTTRTTRTPKEIDLPDHIELAGIRNLFCLPDYDSSPLRAREENISVHSGSTFPRAFCADFQLFNLAQLLSNLRFSTSIDVVQPKQLIIGYIAFKGKQE
jgi:hypothetical protein